MLCLFYLVNTTKFLEDIQIFLRLVQWIIKREMETVFCSNTQSKIVLNNLIVRKRVMKFIIELIICQHSEEAMIFALTLIALLIQMVVIAI